MGFASARNPSYGLIEDNAVQTDLKTLTDRALGD
jgi:hypothetical protein